MIFKKSIAVLALAAMTLSSPAFAQSSNYPTGLHLEGNYNKGTGQADRLLGSKALDLPSVADLPNVKCDGVTDDSAALAAGLAQYIDTGSKILVPNGCRLLMGGAAQVRLQGFSLVGPYGRDDGKKSSTGYGQMGGTFLFTDTQKTPFLVGSQWQLSGLVFYWPNQTEAAMEANNGKPIVYPAMIKPYATNTDDQFWSFDHNQVVNAYVVADFSTDQSIGHYHWDDNSEFALNTHIIMGQAGGEGWIKNNQASIIAFFYDVNGSVGTQMINYVATHSTFLSIVGNGTSGNPTQRTVDGATIVDNYVLRHLYGIHVSGGGLHLSTIDGNGFDQVPAAIAVDNGGTLNNTTIVGGLFACADGEFNQAASIGGYACIGVSNAGGGNLPTVVNITGINMPYSLGSGIEINDPSENGNLSISNSTINGTGVRGNANTSYYGIFWGGKGQFTLSGSIVGDAGHSANAPGVTSNSTFQTVLVGNAINNYSTPVVLNGSGNTSITGNSSINTHNTGLNSAIQGSNASLAVEAGNRWDVGAISTHMYAKSGQPDQINCDGGAASIGCQFLAKGTGSHKFFVNGGSSQVLQVGSDNGGSNSALIAGGSGATYTSAAGPTTINSASGNTNITSSGSVAISRVLPCSAAPSGFMCSQGGGQAVIVKP